VFVKFSIGLNADYTDPRWEQKVTEGIKENELLGYFQGFADNYIMASDDESSLWFLNEFSFCERLLVA
jgi:hypothetical protein